VELQRKPPLHFLEPPVKFADQILKAFLPGDEAASFKQTELANVKLIQKLYEAFMRGDATELLDAFHDAIDWHIVGPEAIPFAGHAQGEQARAPVLQRSLATVDNQCP
jgi:hypothetical protein